MTQLRKARSITIQYEDGKVVIVQNVVVRRIKERYGANPTGNFLYTANWLSTQEQVDKTAREGK